MANKVIKQSISLKKNVLYMFMANFIYALSNWFQLSLVSKLMNINDLGEYTLSIAIVSPLFLFFCMQLRSLILTDHKDEFSYATYFSFRLFTSIIFLLIVCFLGILMRFNLSILILYALIRCIEGVADISNGKCQQLEQMKTVFISIASKSILLSIGFFVGLYFFKSIQLGFILGIASMLVFLLFYDIKRNMFEKFILRSFEYRSLLIKAFPLAIVIVVISLNTNISKFYIEYFIDTSTQGIYSSLSYCIILGSFIANAIGQTVSPRLSRYYQERDKKKFDQIQNRFTLFTIIIGVLAIIISIFGGEFILNFLFNQTIAAYKNQFVLIMVSGLFIYIATSLGYTLTSMREFKIQPYINGTILCLNLICSYFLVKNYGINGAIYTTIFCYVIQVIITYSIIKKKSKLQFYK